MRDEAQNIPSVFTASTPGSGKRRIPAEVRRVLADEHVEVVVIDAADDISGPWTAGTMTCAASPVEEARARRWLADLSGGATERSRHPLDTDELIAVVNALHPEGWPGFIAEASEAARVVSAAHFPFLGGACLTAEPLDDILDSALSDHRADELDERTTSEVIRDTLTDSDNAAVVRSWLADVGLIGGAS